MTQQGRFGAIVVAAAMVVSLVAPLAQAAPKGCTASPATAGSCSWKVTKSGNVLVVAAGGQWNARVIAPGGGGDYICAMGNGVFGAGVEICYVTKGWTVRLFAVFATARQLN